MIVDNLNNICSSGSGTVCNNSVDKRLDALEQFNTENSVHFESQNITAQKLSANDAKLTKVVAGSVTTDSIDGGAGILDSLKVNGNIIARNFSIEEPVIVSGLTTGKADIATLNNTTLNSDNANIKNLTVENLMTPADATLEYKNINVSDTATINTLNLTNPYIAAVETGSLKTPNLETQEVLQKDNGTIKRVSSTDPTQTQNVISYGDKVMIVGDLENSVNLAGIDRPKWNDRALATLSDIETGGVTPVYKGTLETFDELPKFGNAKGDLYVIRQLTIADKMGIGHAQWNGKSWDPYLIYELEEFETKADAAEAVRLLEEKITANKGLIDTNTTNIETNTAGIAANKKAIEDEMADAVNRETAIIDGVTPIKKAAAGLVNTEGELFATTDDALMLYGAEGMDNIAENTSLDDIVTCSQYSADDTLAATITEAPTGETGAFDLIVGYFNTDKTQPYQVYINKASQKIFYRFTIDGMYDMVWRQLANDADITALEDGLANGTVVAKEASNSAKLDNKTYQDIIDSIPVPEGFPVNSVITIEAVTEAEARQSLPPYGTWVKR